LELNANVKSCTSALTLDQLLRAVLRNNGRLLESWILVHLVPHYFTCAEQGVFLRLGLLNKTWGFLWRTYIREKPFSKSYKYQRFWGSICLSVSHAWINVAISGKHSVPQTFREWTENL